MPVSFSDLAKTATKVLSDDYKIGKIFLKAKSPAGPVAVTTENTLKSKDGDYSIEGKVSASWPGVNGFKVNKVAMDAQGKGDLELALDDVVPGLGFKFKASLFGDDATLEAAYKQDQVNSVTALDLNFTSVAQSLVVGYKQLSVGGEVDFDIEKSAVKDYNAGASFSTESNQLVAAYTTTGEKTPMIFNLAVAAPFKNLLAAATASFEKPGKLVLGTVGAVVALSADTTVRAAVDTNKKLKAAVAHTIVSKVKATGCVEVDLNAVKNTPAWGVNLQLG